MWQVRIIGNARKQVKRFPRSDQKRILESLETLGINPFILDIVKLKGTKNDWRLRVGNYRISFELFQKEKAVFIYNIKRRTSATY